MTTTLSPRDTHVIHIQALPAEVLWRIMRVVDFTSRRTRVPLVCKAWRDLARDPSLWSDTLDVTFPTRPDSATPRPFYTTFAASVTAWLSSAQASPSSVAVKHSGRPDREGTALIQLLQCLRWNVSSVNLHGFSAVTVSSALRVLGKQQRLIGLAALHIGVLDMRHEHRLTDALVEYCGSLQDLRLTVCELVDGHELLHGLSALTALTRLDVVAANQLEDAENAVLDQGIQVADMVWLRALTALRHVELHGVPLPCLPSALTSLQRLTTIRLLHSAAPFEGVGNAFQWPELEELDLSGALTQEVLGCTVPALRTMRLRCVRLGKQDATLFGDLLRPLKISPQLPATLRALDLCCAGQVHGLSHAVLQTVAACVQLTWLDLGRCRLVTLPECFSALQSLRYRCDDCCVDKHPSRVMHRHLDVSDNPLQTLPPLLQHMHELRTLVARNCGELDQVGLLTALPCDLGVLDVTREAGWDRLSPTCGSCRVVC